MFDKPNPNPNPNPSPNPNPYQVSWRAQATIDGQSTTLGTFTTDYEAALCYARHVQGPKKLSKAKLPPTPTRDAASVRLLHLYDAAAEPEQPAAAGQKR